MNEYQSPYGFSGGGGFSGGMGQNRPPVAEETLKTDKIQIERKTFVISLKENPRGRFLRITEDVGGRRDTIILPATGLTEFKRVVDEMVRASDASPSKTPAS
jgi:PurA ssDNA and RNA-binding protein